MRLSKDTWHYRNYELWLDRSEFLKAHELRNGYRQIDLCTYIRIALFWGPIRRIPRWCDAHPIAAIGIVFSVVWVTLGGLISLDSDMTLFQAFILYPAIVFSLLIALAGVVMGVYYLGEWLVDRKETVEKAQPNIIFEHIKAKKRKVCPLIEFEHDEVEEVKYVR